MYKHTPARRHASFGAPKLAIRTTPGKSVRPTIVIVCMRAPERLFFLDFFFWTTSFHWHCLMAHARMTLGIFLSLNLFLFQCARSFLGKSPFFEKQILGKRDDHLGQTLIFANPVDWLSTGALLQNVIS